MSPGKPPLKICVGRSYRLRNGAHVKIVNQREVAARDGVSGKIVRLMFMTGYFIGSRQRCSWETSGKYSPIAGNDHYLDIVGRSR